MKKIFICCALYLFSASLWAENIKFELLTLKNGKTYENVHVLKKLPHGISIMHKTGAARIAYEKLTDETLAMLGGFDPEKAAEYREKLAEEQEALAKKMKAAAEKRAAHKKLLASAEVRKLWVMENRQDGIIVGHFDQEQHAPIVTSLGRLGGGGGSSNKESDDLGFYWGSKNHYYAFIPHSKLTRPMEVGNEFLAKVAVSGTIRLNSRTVLRKYYLIEIE